MDNKQSNTQLLPHLFRQEYTKMTAVLCCHFGLKHIEIAEDIASETFLKACESWAVNGIPENSTAWLYTVAKNKTKDFLKRATLFESKIKHSISSVDIHSEPEFEFSTSNISDSQLAMIFAVCNSINSKEAQIALALQILCGFSVEEIANAFLTKTETIKKRLQRARANLRNNNFQISRLSDAAMNAGLPTVLKTLYLLYNEGYFSTTSDHLIRKDLCSEAIRLTLILAGNTLTNTSQVNALLSLMYFQSSRLDARVGNNGEMISFEEQDRNLWNNAFIERGNYYLVNACSNQEVSKYHLEAAMAYWHTTSADQKWAMILQLYNQLILIEYSPVTALNRIVAFAKVNGHEKAIAEAEKLNLIENNHYHALLGYLYEPVNTNVAVRHYEKAIELSRSLAENDFLKKKLHRLSIENL